MPVLVSQSPRSRHPHPAPPTQHETRHAQPQSSGACSPAPEAPQATEHTPGRTAQVQGGRPDSPQPLLLFLLLHFEIIVAFRNGWDGGPLAGLLPC